MKNLNYPIDYRNMNDLNNNNPIDYRNIYNDSNINNINNNLNNLKSANKLYEQGKMNQRGLSHGYNILTGEIFDKNLPKKEEVTFNYLNPNQNNGINNNNNISPQRKQEHFQNKINEKQEENIPLYKQYPAGFNPKRHPDMFNKKQNNQNYQNIIINNNDNNNYEINQYYNKYNNINTDYTQNQQNIKNVKDDPFDNSLIAKAKRQKEYKESLDAQINRKKEYERNIDNLNYHNSYNRKKNDDIDFNPYTHKTYSIGDKSSLESNPIINPVNHYQFGERRRMSGRLQKNGNNIIG
jgi:hypothetical protein